MEDNKTEDSKHEKMQGYTSEHKKQKHKTEKRKQATEKDYVIAIVVLAGIVLAFFLIANFAPKELLKNVFEKKIKVEIISINADCPDCFSLQPLEASFEKENTQVSRKTLDYESEDAKKIMEKYGIKTVPALVALSKNIDKIEIDKNVFSIGKDYALFDKSVPYVNLETKTVGGKVNLKEIYTDCDKCASISQIEEQLIKFGIKIENYDKISSSSEEGKKMIKENSVSFFPALLVSKNIEEYWWLFDQIKGAFTENTEYYLFNTPLSPYKDTGGNIRGIVDITYIENKSCVECFNVTDLKKSFQGIGMYIDKERFVDVSSPEGANLIVQYKIDAIPTVILSRGIEDYESIKKTLEQVGSFVDGKFIFRKLDVLQVKYQKLNENGGS